MRLIRHVATSPGEMSSFVCSFTRLIGSVMRRPRVMPEATDRMSVQSADHRAEGVTNGIRKRREHYIMNREKEKRIKRAIE